MITLNTEKGLIIVDSWSDVESRPGFLSKLNPANYELKTLIGSYDFTSKINCGLTTCNTPHYKGYVVATSDGYETNIGKDCGKKYFDADFESLSRDFDRQVTELENRNRVRDFNIESVSEKITFLRHQPKGADWVNKNVRFLSAKSQCPDAIVDALSNMVKTRNNHLTGLRKASESEIAAIELVENKTVGRPHYVEDHVATISGIEALYPDNDLRELVVLELEESINLLKTKKVDSLSYSELEKWAKWIGTVDTSIDTVSSIIEQGRLLLTKDNLSPLSTLIESKSDRSRFSTFLDKLKKAS